MNPKELYPFKICDPIHGFIRFNEIERKVINSQPFQRLRYIHQMGCAYLVYPGATHKRFEHSIGTMELVTRIYDNITHPRNISFDLLKNFLPESFEELMYWRQILRLAALCHDLGHLPFSHTAEEKLLPKGGHEDWTVKLIQYGELKELWSDLSFKGRSAEIDIITLSVNEKELKEMGIFVQLSPWQKVLSQIITEDNFGADRIDYLLRDSRFTGVGFGNFDFHQLIDTLRILPSLNHQQSLSLGSSESGLQSIESLWIARYLMYARVYHHPKSRIYSHHLSRFMKAHFEDVGFPLRSEDYLKLTDFTVLYELMKSIEDSSKPGHFDACCLMQREACFQEVHIDEIDETCLNRVDRFKDDFFVDIAPSKQRIADKAKLRQFPVLTDRGDVVSSLEVSVFLPDIPLGVKPFRLYVNPTVKSQFIDTLNG